MTLLAYLKSDRPALVISQLRRKFAYTEEETVRERGVGYMLSDRAHKALIEYIPISVTVIFTRSGLTVETSQ